MYPDLNVLRIRSHPISFVTGEISEMNHMNQIKSTCDLAVLYAEIFRLEYTCHSVMIVDQ